LRADGFRAEMHDGASGALGARIRRAKTEKVPYVLVVGDTDVENGTVGVNARAATTPTAMLHSMTSRRASAKKSPNTVDSQ
jgi:threonyl-tRNA synthetase